MSVKYAKPVAIIFILMGLVLLGLGGLLMSMTGQFPMNFVLGTMILIFGVLALNNPLLVLEKDELQARNLLGMTLKRYPIDSLRVDTGKGAPRMVSDQPNGKTKTVLKPSFFFDNSATKALMDTVAARAFD